MTAQSVTSGDLWAASGALSDLAVHFKTRAHFFSEDVGAADAALMKCLVSWWGAESDADERCRVGVY